MSAIRQACQALVLVVLAASFAVAKEPARPAGAKAAPMKLNFMGVDYVHRLTFKGRSDFTPAAQPDLKAFRDRLTIVVSDKPAGSEQLSTIAGNIMGTVSDLGEVVSTDSRANPATHETEHFIAAQMQAPGYTQAAFARVALVEGKAVVVVFTHRSYGEHAAESNNGWMDRNGEATERALMSWTGTPGLARLRALPQAR